MAMVKEIVLKRRAEAYQEDEARMFAVETLGRIRGEVGKLKSLDLHKIRQKEKNGKSGGQGSREGQPQISAPR